MSDYGEKMADACGRGFSPDDARQFVNASRPLPSDGCDYCGWIEPNPRCAFCSGSNEEEFIRQTDPLFGREEDDGD